MAEPYDLRVAASAARALQEALPEALPEAVAAAAVEFITGSLLADPRRVGKPLRRELEGRWSARRGAFRIVYRIDDADQLVTVLRVEHRSDVYRPR